MPRSFLDDLPLDLLLQMQEAMVDPCNEARVREEKRTLDAGFYIRHTVEMLAKQPLPMGPAPKEHRGEELRFGDRTCTREE